MLYFGYNTVILLLKIIYLGSVEICMGETMLKAYICERCRHTWVPAGIDKPRVCPKCKSPYWDRPRRTDVVREKPIKKEFVKGEKVRA
jgi:hypothetical protein